MRQEQEYQVDIRRVFEKYLNKNVDDKRRRRRGGKKGDVS